MVSVLKPTKSAANPGAICPMSSRPRFLAPPWMAILSTLRQFTAWQAVSSAAALLRRHACHANVLDHLPELRSFAEFLHPQSEKGAQRSAAQSFTALEISQVYHVCPESPRPAQLVLGGVRVPLTALFNRAS